MKGVRIRLQNHIVASMPRSYISLGGNLGAVANTFATALDRLGRVPGNAVVAVSISKRLRSETAPVAVS
jgi:7,8-dihydro-6-hydroxymethylpterin-pyrophosphokinase